MFLAIREIMFSKTRYVLIVIVIMLTTYLTVFLTGLAYGLAQDNRSSIDSWQADGIILSEDANNTIAMSYINEQQFDSIKAKETAKLRVTPAILSSKEKNSEESVNAYIFGVETDSFIVPKVSEGTLFHAANEVVVDSSLHTKYGFNIGDSFTLTSLDVTLKITGFTENEKFNTAPVLFMSLQDYQTIIHMPSSSIKDTSINAVVYRGDVTYDQSSLKSLSIESFINELPGYRPEVLTFGLMIGFLIGIVAFVLGIFIYVLTVQKTAMFGIMKAQGISNKTIIRSVLSQTFLLTLFGVLIGMLLLGITVLFLPSAVPFQLDPLMIGLILGLIFIFSIIGGLFSVRSATKVDPLIAMGV